MSYKLIVTDMDGTLLNSKSNVSERTKRALQGLHKKGVHIAIATGRIYTTAKIYGEQLGIVTPIICSNGAIVKNLKDDKIIFSQPLKKEDAIKIIDICKENNMYFYFYSHDTIYSESEERRLLYFSEWGKTLNEKDQIKIEIISDSKKIIENDTIYKFGVQHDDMVKLESITNIIKSNLDVETHKSWLDLVDVMDRGVSKGKAVERLANSLGVKREEIITIGDNENDLSMLEYAGLGVAMGNAIDKVKDMADYITDTNDNDGVAKVIEKFLT